MNRLHTVLLFAAYLATPAFCQSSETTVAPSQLPPELQQLAVFFGTWTYEMDTHATPLWGAMKSTGTDTTRPLLDGFAVQAEFHDRTAAGEARYHELNWLDPQTGRIAYTYLGNDGYVETGSYAFDKAGDTWSWEGTFTIEGKAWMSRGKGVLAADRASFIQTAEISADGKTWIPAFTKRAKKANTPSTDTAAVEQALIQLELAWAAASVNSDITTLDRLLADLVAFGLFEGKWQTKAEFLDDYRSGKFDSTSEAQDGVKARVYGDVAIATGRTTMTARFNGQDASGQFLWTDTWV
jgi:hypothetical protein